MKISIAVIGLVFFLAACNNNDSSSENDNQAGEKKVSTPVINYSLTASFPHDTTSYTEGFLFHNGQLFESTGYDSAFRSTRSLFGVVNLKTGVIDVKAELDKKKFFGEGIVFLNDKIYQLTYTTKIGFIYDAKTFKKLGEFTFPSEQGWGMTTDSTSLIMTDGTSTITYLNPNDFKTVKTLSVTDENGTVLQVNEPEYIKGFIYANIFMTNYIFKIDPVSGKVVGKINLQSLADEAKIRYPGSQQMNGIAYDIATDKIYVTGKLWPNIYEISFSH
ncbi:MAG: glutaminyl-peptide cyclotransferase [Bacteroidota bacterium]